MNGARRESQRLVWELRSAALQAQELLLATRAIEACVSALNRDTPATTVIETSLLVRAAALQIAALLHDLVAQSERLALLAAGALEGQILPGQDEGKFDE